MEYNLQPYERETVIIMNDEDDYATVTTSQRTIKHKIEKLLNSNPSDCRILECDDTQLEVYIPKKWVKISKPKQINYSEETKAKMGERLKKARELRKKED